MLSLRPYQVDALAAVEAAHAAGMQRPMVAHATGLGKTVLFAHLIGKRPGRALVLAHRDELLQQARAKIKMVNPLAQVGIVRAELDQYGAPIVVASVPTLARAARRERIPKDFATIICDEAHHSEASSYQAIFHDFGCYEEGGPLLLGVTATPERGDKKALGNTWEGIVHRQTILDGIKGGYLSDLRAQRVQIDADWSAMRTKGGEIVDADAERVLMDADAPHEIAEALREFGPDRKAIVFTPTVKVAFAVAQAVRGVGIAAEGLCGDTPEDERKAILRRLHTGETRVVANAMVLTEGFDEPSVDCIVLARPTKSRPLIVQMIGRGTRLYPGKKDCLVLDCCGAAARRDLMGMADIFEGDETAAAAVFAASLGGGKSVRQALEELKAEVAREEEANKQEVERRGRLIAQGVELFADRSFTWVPSNAGFILSLGDREKGWLALREGADGVWTVQQEGGSAAPSALWSGPSLEYGQGFAEDFARTHGTKAFVQKDAPWRLRDASDKQMATLRRFGIHTTGLTAGQASDLITERVAMAAGRSRRAAAR